jgi:hypothetical protein
MANCVPPGAVIHSGSLRQAFGDMVERIVQQHYCADAALRRLGPCSPFIPPNLGGARSEFFDEDAGVHRCDLMASFLKFHNAHLDEQQIANACRATHPKPLLMKVPDIISHRFARHEFYEIKPNSRSGIRGGEEKIAWFSALCHASPPPAAPLLPYVEGTQYTPDFTHMLSVGAAFGAPFRIGIHIFRPPRVPALVLYELCPAPTRESQERCVTALMSAGAVMGVLRFRFDATTAQQALDAMVLAAESPLRQPVGRPGPAGASPNLPADVRYVQLLLNDWRGRQNQPLIAEDGVWQPGGETDSAIIAVQQETANESNGQVASGGFSIGVLETRHLHGLYEAADGALAESPLPRVQESTIYHDLDDEEDGDGVSGVTPAELVLALQEELRGYLRRLY